MAKIHRKGANAQSDQLITERKCIVSRVVKPINEMLRFVHGPEGDVVVDLKRILPGRGVWVTATKADIDAAVEKNLFQKGFKQGVKVDRNLGLKVENLLTARVLSTLSLSRKAGLVTIGHEKVASALGKDPIIAVIFASDGAEDGIRKIRQKLKAKTGSERPFILQNLRSDELGLAFGRSNVVHAALRQGGVARHCIEYMTNLDRYREGFGADNAMDLPSG